jgi:hypothetical protein
VRPELNQRTIRTLGIVPPPALEEIVRDFPNALTNALNDARASQCFKPPNMCFHESFRIIV